MLFGITMRQFATTLTFMFLAAALQAAIPTPDSALKFHIEKDPRKWVVQHKDGSKAGFLMELVPAGDTIKAWKEMAAHQIVFTKKSLRKHADTFKELLLKADPKSEVAEETLKDGSILLTYTAKSADETSVRRFIKGKDGIYMLAYHVRPKIKNEENWRIWSEIVRAAELFPNPEKKK